MIKELEGISYETKEPLEYKAYRRHYHRLWMRNNRGKVAQYQRQHYDKHKEAEQERSRRNYQEQAEERKAMRAAKRMVANYIKYHFNDEFREQKKEHTIQQYYIKKEEVKKVTVVFD